MSAGYVERSLTSHDFMRHFVEEFNGDGMPVLTMFLKSKDLINDTDNILVISGEYTTLSFPPNSKAIIRIVPGNKTSEWLATRSRYDIFTTFIDAIIRITTNKEVIDEYIHELGGAIQNYLNDMRRLQFTVRGTKPPVVVFDSWARDIDVGYTVDRNMRIARITHISKVDVLYTPNAN